MENSMKDHKINENMNNGSSDKVELHWLDGKSPDIFQGTTWGIPWEKGRLNDQSEFMLCGPENLQIPVQSWPLAWWPDGSLKWSAHAIAGKKGLDGNLTLKTGKEIPENPADRREFPSLIIKEDQDSVSISTGLVDVRLRRNGENIIESLRRNGLSVLTNGRLVVLRKENPDSDGQGTINIKCFAGEISAVKLEQSGPIRAVVKVDGMHHGHGRQWLPFTIRFYFYAGSDIIRVLHTFIFDGDENKDFISGIGIRFDVPLRDQMHDRHIRFGGEGHGLWAEAVRPLTGLRRDPGKDIREHQTKGLKCPPTDEFEIPVRSRLDLIPCWGDFSLTQPNAHGFTIRKRTKPGCGWVDADQGRRSSGTVFIGGPEGGIAAGLRDFWQNYPAQIDIRNALTDSAEVTLWLWSPDSPAMDLRFYHDGMGMDTHEKELEGLAITYEDYEKGWGSANGVARTSELYLWASASTPGRNEMAGFSDMIRNPPILTADPSYYLSAGVFGRLWKLPDRSNTGKKRIEESLDWLLDFYKNQVDQRNWYGFWNYGDFMHTYDYDRHIWRYDIGGYAWDNSELSTDLWLWYSYLRTGRADVFRLAEAMTRHTGEVDVYHSGRFKGLGTRHNVRHWGCSAKQARISTALNRRFYFYLTSDERIGDLLKEQLDTDKMLDEVDPIRKLPLQPDKIKGLSRVNFGTDWCSLASAWLTEWERGGDVKYRDKLLRGMKDIGSAPWGFWSGCPFGYNSDTGALTDIMNGKIEISSLSTFFGAIEICAELIQLTADMDLNPGFTKAWINYCELYNAPLSEQAALLPRAIKGGFPQHHARLSACAAYLNGKPELALRAWIEFLVDPAEMIPNILHFTGPDVLNPVDEAPGISTNDASQWSLGAIQMLALIGDFFPLEISPEDRLSYLESLKGQDSFLGKVY
jgi:hypothetical protein